ncbi:MAG: hypothetical protein EOL87_08850 [Spartobacteria bacterium]|nr:hypothetical protein [Spartobacteria bacterium]
MKKLVIALVGLLVAGSVMAANNQSTALVKMKSGTCVFKMLDASGIKPLKGADLKLNNVDNGKMVAEAKANQNGVASVDVNDGRYVVSVDGKKLAIVDASAVASITECRLIVPDMPMQVGGQELGGAGALAAGGGGGAGGVAAAGGGLFGLSTTTLIVSGVAVVGAGVATAAVIEENRNKDDDPTPTPTPVPTPAPPTPDPPSA